MPYFPSESDTWHGPPVTKSRLPRKRHAAPQKMARCPSGHILLFIPCFLFTHIELGCTVQRCLVVVLLIPRIHISALQKAQKNKLYPSRCDPYHVCFTSAGLKRMHSMFSVCTCTLYHGYCFHQHCDVAFFRSKKEKLPCIYLSELFLCLVAVPFIGKLSPRCSTNGFQIAQFSADCFVFSGRASKISINLQIFAFFMICLASISSGVRPGSLVFHNPNSICQYAKRIPVISCS